jgi:hypothetical protein
MMMEKTKLLSNLLAVCFLTFSCSTPAKVDVDFIRNYDSPAISSVGIAFKINVPTESDSIYYNIKTDIGIVNPDPKFHCEIKVKSDDVIYWSSHMGYILDEDKNYRKYGFIEGIISKEDRLAGYFLVAIKYYYPEQDPDGFEYIYKAELISSMYDEKISERKVNKSIEKEKENYAKQFN